MSTIKVKVELAPVEMEIDKDDYNEQYLEDCSDNGDDPEDEPPDGYVIEAFKQQLDDGDKDISEVFESSKATVTRI